jgi:hypothetical protein
VSIAGSFWPIISTPSTTYDVIPKTNQKTIICHFRALPTVSSVPPLTLTLSPPPRRESDGQPATFSDSPGLLTNLPTRARALFDKRPHH